MQHLDMLRGIASLGVVIGHARSFTLVPWADSQSHGFASKAVYTVGGLGHACVIVFFALSGFLVGGAAFAAMRRDAFSWRAYAAARLARLWTVLVPALGLTILLDTIGVRVAPPGAYEGAFYALLASGPSETVPSTHAFPVILGNLFFLQTILVPVLGSNGPLWSLAYEAWYYVLFPFIAFGLYVRSGTWRAVAFGATGLVILLLLPVDVVLLSVPWVAGAIIAAVSEREHAEVKVLRATISSLLVVVSLAYEVASKTSTSDVVLGCVVAFWLRDLASMPRVTGAYTYLAHALSEISFTLYATHFPLLALLWFWLVAPLQRQPDIVAVLQIIGFVIAALSYAAVVWYFFERRTMGVRATFMRALAACDQSLRMK